MSETPDLLAALQQSLVAAKQNRRNDAEEGQYLGPAGNTTGALPAQCYSLTTGRFGSFMDRDPSHPIDRPTPAEIAQLRAERDAALAKIEAAKAIHSKVIEDSLWPTACAGCADESETGTGPIWPCAVARVLTNPEGGQ